MDNRELTITPPEGYEIDREKSTFEKIVFKTIEEKLPEKWEDFNTIKGYWIDGDAKIQLCVQLPLRTNMHVWPTKELTEASLALCQLVRYRDAWNKGWQPDWNNDATKYGICCYNNIIQIQPLTAFQVILVFQYKDIAIKFMTKFSNLIKTAKPLL